ncbi:MAG: carboxypeptidase regulatory-like domain-containing protein [Archaeoglobi archaeon]|nr:carboxypeptidase regulatory-like domain-containing protein [Candidatus Mnemosynella bozhongmuii]
MRRSVAFCLILSILLSSLPASAQSELEIYCDYPGQIAEAGDTVRFDVTVRNLGETDGVFTLNHYCRVEDWDVYFEAGGKRIYKLFIPAGGSRSFTAVIETSGDTEIGEYPVTISVGTETLDLYVKIVKTHEGERGTLTLRVVDKEGENVKGAEVRIYNSSGIVDVVKTTSDGEISVELPKGDYWAEIVKEGYEEKRTESFEIKIGRTTDLGVITIEKKDYFVSLSCKIPYIVSYIGESPLFKLEISNLGKEDDRYSLRAENLPSEWGYRFKESADGAEISEIYIPSGETRELYLEIIPPYDAEPGEYSFVAIARSPNSESSLNLTLKLTGVYRMSIYSPYYSYEIKKGESAKITLTVINSGSGTLLTNIRPEVSAPEGWSARISPESKSKLESGERVTFEITLIPPADIVASDYKVTVKIKSDQLEEEEDFRITVEESSYAFLYGILIIAAIFGSLYYLFRKYGRR